MNTTTLQLTSNGKTLGSINLRPVQQLRLLAFAKKNKLSLMDMIDLAIRFAIAPENAPVDMLKCPEEEEIVAIAAKMLAPRR